MRAQPSKKKHPSKPFEQPVWCGLCHVRVAPYELAVRVMRHIYHSRCLDHLRHRPRQPGQSE
jgi:hypothetical protein